MNSSTTPASSENTASWPEYFGDGNSTAKLILEEIGINASPPTQIALSKVNKFFYKTMRTLWALQRSEYASTSEQQERIKRASISILNVQSSPGFWRFSGCFNPENPKAFVQWEKDLSSRFLPIQKKLLGTSLFSENEIQILQQPQEDFFPNSRLGIFPPPKKLTEWLFLAEAADLIFPFWESESSLGIPTHLSTFASAAEKAQYLQVFLSSPTPGFTGKVAITLPTLSWRFIPEAIRLSESVHELEINAIFHPIETAQPLFLGLSKFSKRPKILTFPEYGLSITTNLLQNPDITNRISSLFFYQRRFIATAQRTSHSQEIIEGLISKDLLPVHILAHDMCAIKDDCLPRLLTTIQTTQFLTETEKSSYMSLNTHQILTNDSLLLSLWALVEKVDLVQMVMSHSGCRPDLSSFSTIEKKHQACLDFLSSHGEQISGEIYSAPGLPLPPKELQKLRSISKLSLDLWTGPCGLVESSLFEELLAPLSELQILELSFHESIPKMIRIPWDSSKLLCNLKNLRELIFSDASPVGKLQLFPNTREDLIMTWNNSGEEIISLHPLLFAKETALSFKLKHLTLPPFPLVDKHEIDPMQVFLWVHSLTNSLHQKIDFALKVQPFPPEDQQFLLSKRERIIPTICDLKELLDLLAFLEKRIGP